MCKVVINCNLLHFFFFLQKRSIAYYKIYTEKEKKTEFFILKNIPLCGKKHFVSLSMDIIYCQFTCVFFTLVLCPNFFR